MQLIDNSEPKPNFS